MIKKYRIETKKFYNLSCDLKKYAKRQIERHEHKIGKKRLPYFYDRPIMTACKALGLMSNNLKVICLGTRNNHERDCIRKLIKQKFSADVGVKSLDIGPKSKADYVMSFNDLPNTWTGYWDIIYSNSLDHAIDATITFNEWCRILRKGGVLVLSFVDEGHPEHALTETDCCSFNRENILNYINHHDEVKLFDIFEEHEENFRVPADRSARPYAGHHTTVVLIKVS